jgi:NAD(P)H dehydrogenase (quinone)
VWPIFTLAYVGYDVLAPFVAYGVEGGLRYSDQSTIDARLQGIVQDFRNQLAKLDQRKKTPFNRMADWGADGRIRPDAPVDSPFIRHRENLELE